MTQILIIRLKVFEKLAGRLSKTDTTPKVKRQIQRGEKLMTPDCKSENEIEI